MIPWALWKRRQPVTDATGAIVLLAGMILGFHFLPLHPVVAYAGLFLVASAVYLVFAHRVFKTEISDRTVVVLLGIGVLARLSFLTTTPVGSDDVYRYLWDGKVQVAGINPYAYTPNAVELQHLHSSLLPSSVNHPDMKTVYFPFTQWLFYLCYRIGGEHLWALKGSLLLAEILSLLCLSALTKHLHIPPKFVLLYALCPLPILQFSLDAHVDGFGLPFLLGTLLFFLRGRKTLSLVLLALSVSVKPITLVILPILFLLEKGWGGRARAVLVPGVIVGAQFLPYIVDANPFEALTTFTKHWVYNGALFELLNLYFSDNQKTRIVCAVLLSLSLLVLYGSRWSFSEKVFYSILFVLILSPVVHPWYLTWMAVLLPLSRAWSGILFAGTVSLTSFTVVTYTLSGVWEQYPLVLVGEYVPVIAVLVWELWKGQKQE